MTFSLTSFFRKSTYSHDSSHAGSHLVDCDKNAECDDDHGDAANEDAVDEDAVDDDADDGPTHTGGSGVCPRTPVARRIKSGR